MSLAEVAVSTSRRLRLETEETELAESMQGREELAGVLDFATHVHSVNKEMAGSVSKAWDETEGLASAIRFWT